MSKRPITAILIAIIAGTMLTACGQEPSEAPASDLENGVSAIEDVNGTALDSTYVPDELDAVPAHASAAGMIYSFYCRLSVGNMDASWLSESNLPPTFYVYGTEDPFYRQFQQQYDVISGMGIPTGRIVLSGWPHGFGSDGGWLKGYAVWLEAIFSNADKG